MDSLLGLERNQWINEPTEFTTQDNPPHTQMHSMLLLGILRPIPELTSQWFRGSIFQTV